MSRVTFGSKLAFRLYIADGLTGGLGVSGVCLTRLEELPMQDCGEQASENGGADVDAKLFELATR